MIKICLSGLGRAGSQIARYLLERDDAKIISACCAPDSPKRGKDLGEILNYRDTGIIVDTVEDMKPYLSGTLPDVVIDFSTPWAALKNAELFAKMKINIVMGTTGFSPDEETHLFSMIKKHKTGLIYAPNITMGVNVLMLLTELASRLLSNYDAEIIEMHHKNKKDIPSATAKKISGVINGNSLDETKAADTPISSVRAGGIIGYHKVVLAGEHDKIEIVHESMSRNAFAEGALYAAKFINHKTGLFEMRDMLKFGELLADYFSGQGGRFASNMI